MKSNALRPIAVASGAFGVTVKPSFLQYIFARNWPMKAFFSAAVVLGLSVAVSTCQPSVAMLGDWLYLVLFVVSIVLAPVLAFFLSLPLAWMVLAPFYCARARLNGAPFQVGDTVRILAGPHQGRITQVYSLWQGDALRVRLGKEEEDTYKDVFAPTQVVRESNVEASSALNGGPATLLGNSGAIEDRHR